MKIESRQFWESVKSEYLRNFNEENFYICSNSNVFEGAYMDENKKVVIRVLAKEFLKIKINRILFKSASVSYYSLFSCSSDKKIDIRLSFLDWCIDKYKKGV
jgi:hypothetical protein